MVLYQIDDERGLYAFFLSYLSDANILQVRLFKRQQLFAGNFVFDEGVAVHGKTDGLQPLGHGGGGPLVDDLHKTVARLVTPGGSVTASNETWDLKVQKNPRQIKHCVGSNLRVCPDRTCPIVNRHNLASNLKP